MKTQIPHAKNKFPFIASFLGEMFQTVNFDFPGLSPQEKETLTKAVKNIRDHKFTTTLQDEMDAANLASQSCLLTGSYPSPQTATEVISENRQRRIDRLNRRNTDLLVTKVRLESELLEEREVRQLQDRTINSNQALIGKIQTTVDKTYPNDRLSDYDMLDQGVARIAEDLATEQEKNQRQYESIKRIAELVGNSVGSLEGIEASVAKVVDARNLAQACEAAQGKRIEEACEELKKVFPRGCDLVRGIKELIEMYNTSIQVGVVMGNALLKETKVRRFRHVDGFIGSTDYIEVRPDGSAWFIYKDKRNPQRTEFYTLDDCLRLVSEGTFVELIEAPKVRRFRHTEGFGGGLDLMEVRPDGSVWYLYRNGDYCRADAWTLESCLDIVAEGYWVELDVPKVRRFRSAKNDWTATDFVEIRPDNTVWIYSKRLEPPVLSLSYSVQDCEVFVAKGQWVEIPVEGYGSELW